MSDMTFCAELIYMNKKTMEKSIVLLLINDELGSNTYKRKKKPHNVND